MLRFALVKIIFRLDKPRTLNIELYLLLVDDLDHSVLVILNIEVIHRLSFNLVKELNVFKNILLWALIKEIINLHIELPFNKPQICLRKRLFLILLLVEQAESNFILHQIHHEEEDHYFWREIDEKLARIFAINYLETNVVFHAPILDFLEGVVALPEVKCQQELNDHENLSVDHYKVPIMLLWSSFF